MQITQNIIHSIFTKKIIFFLNSIKDLLNNSRLGRGVFWSLVGAVISGGLTLVGMVFVAQIIGKTDYGKLGIIQSTVGMLGIFAGLGLGITATKYVAKFRVRDPNKASRIIALTRIFSLLVGGILAIGLLFFAPWLAINTLNDPALTPMLRIGALILLINAINGVQVGILSGLEEFKTITQVNLYVGLFSFPILLSGAYFGKLEGVILALLANLFITLILNHFALKKSLKKHGLLLNITKPFQEKAVLWKFSLPAMLAGSMVGPVNWFCYSILVNQPNGYSEMGILNAANQWYALLLFLPQIISRVALPIFSDQIEGKDIKKSREIFLQALKINLIFTTPLIIIIISFSKLMMSLYGEDFSTGWGTLSVVVITAGLLAIQTPAGQIIAASGKMWVGFIMNIAWGISFIFGTYLLIEYGSLGLAIAQLSSYALHALWTFGFVFYLLKNKKYKGKSS